MATLAGKTLLITGASRGIGKAIALRAARDGANVAIVAKTAEPQPKLFGTVYSAAAEIDEAGGKGLPLVTDIRSEAQVEAAVAKTVAAFGGIDILVNNASALSLTGTLQTPMKRYDLMHGVNVRGTYLCTAKCVPHLLESSNPHVLTIAPPLSLDARWFRNHTAYTIAKYGMGMCVVGHAAEFEGKIAVNALWPRSGISTAAIRNVLGGEDAIKRCRQPEIMADAAYAILVRDFKSCTGNFFIDEGVLRDEGVRDFDQYAVDPSADLLTGFFVD